MECQKADADDALAVVSLAPAKAVRSRRKKVDAPFHRVVGDNKSPQ